MSGAGGEVFDDIAVKAKVRLLGRTGASQQVVEDMETSLASGYGG